MAILHLHIDSYLFLIGEWLSVTAAGVLEGKCNNQIKYIVEYTNGPYRVPKDVLEGVTMSSKRFEDRVLEKLVGQDPAKIE